jgi:hypothetical protein
MRSIVGKLPQKPLLVRTAAEHSHSGCTSSIKTILQAPRGRSSLHIPSARGLSRRGSQNLLRRYLLAHRDRRS